MIHKYDNNPFCSLYIDFYDLYMKRDLDKIHNNKSKSEDDNELKAEPKVITPSLKDRFFKKSFPVPENYYKPKISRSMEDIEFESKLKFLQDRKTELEKESFTIEGISFNVLWDFIEFIDFTKKILLYEDNNSSFKSTIAEKDGKEHRYITIKYTDNISLLFDLFTVANPNSKNNIECIKISKVMGENKESITVTDAQIEFDNEANVYLINSINYILCNHCKTKMMILYDSLYSFFLDRNRRSR